MARTVLGGVCAALVVGMVSFVHAQEAPPARAEAPSSERVQMAEIVLDGQTVRGRVLADTDELIRLESLHGTIGYRKDSISELRRFTVSRTAYYEERGDHHHERAWDAEDPADAFIHARRAYQQALAHAQDAVDRDRIEAKLEGVASEREQYHQEALRRQEVARARQEAALIELEKQLTEEKLRALRRQEQEIRELATAYRQVHQELLIALDRLDRIERDIAELEDDLDDIFIRHSVFLDLKRSHLRLERVVRRLERSLERHEGP
jgi:hypothetical protein